LARFKAFFVAVIIFCAFVIPTQVKADDATFTDVPTDSWAGGAIKAAVQDGLMSGIGNGQFGYGKSITRAEFIQALCNLFGWEPITPASPTYADVTPDKPSFGYVEAAAAQGVTLINNTTSDGKSFAPDDPILCKDMAVLMIKALGYDSLAGQVAKIETVPFNGVDSDQGYIIVANDIGIISGSGDGKFTPNNTATREEAADILMRTYDKLHTKTDWLHYFYGFSSYSQKDYLNSADAVTFCWSAMSWSEDSGVTLNTTSAGGNQWRIPDGYDSVMNSPPIQGNGIKSELGVSMDVSTGLSQMLAGETARAAAVNAIIAEATRVYDAIGRNPYNGVTIDFEGLKGADSKAQFSVFLKTLADTLHGLGKNLYVTVPPVTSDGVYFDGYDYKAIGDIADRVILMAHDYEPISMDGFVGTTWEKNAALTPIAQVYTALKAITDPDTGVQNKSKIMLAISFTNVGWMIDDNYNVVSPDPVKPALDTVQARMNQPDTEFGWSDVYCNPYMVYKTEDGSRVFLWYENQQSVSEKIKLARMFGVSGVSVWRLGIIPDWFANMN